VGGGTLPAACAESASDANKQPCAGEENINQISDVHHPAHAHEERQAGGTQDMKPASAPQVS
jgi:hypothetical protein